MTKGTIKQQLAIMKAIADARQRANLSQRELSAKLHQGPTFVQRIESGSRDVTVAEFIVIARALGIEPGELLNDAVR
jgi:transcriptional regulator with XRE-family HTH domain